MKGVVFTEFVDWAESVHGLTMVDAMLARASRQRDGAYAATGAYDWREFADLVTALADLSGTAAPQLLRGYGRHLFGVLAGKFPAFAAGIESSLTMLERIESFIHPEVRKLYPDAELPTFYSERTGNQLRLVYSSPRPFRDFALGLIDGCVKRFNPGANVQWTGTENACEFVITVPEGAACPTTSIR